MCEKEREGVKEEEYSIVYVRYTRRGTACRAPTPWDITYPLLFKVFLFSFPLINQKIDPNFYSLEVLLLDRNLEV